MTSDPIGDVTTLAFDIFGTVLDLSGSLVSPTARLLAATGSSMTADAFWAQWRERQRIEQYQDALLMTGHSGYLETCRRALVYCLRNNRIEFVEQQVGTLMEAYQDLSPFADAIEGLKRLGGSYRLVALSNGEHDFLEHLAENRIKIEFDAIISVEEGGAFKPHPSVYRAAARILGEEPHRIMMVAAHSFDIMGARASGYRGAFVNRYGLPFEETPYQPDIVVEDFAELASRLMQ